MSLVAMPVVAMPVVAMLESGCVPWHVLAVVRGLHPSSSSQRGVARFPRPPVRARMLNWDA